jgi:hypothetical protein
MMRSQHRAACDVEPVEDWKEADEAYKRFITLDEFNDIAEAARKGR